jgi:hypothetical protein
MITKQVHRYVSIGETPMSVLFAKDVRWVLELGNSLCLQKPKANADKNAIINCSNETIRLEAFIETIYFIYPCPSQVSVVWNTLIMLYRIQLIVC